MSAFLDVAEDIKTALVTKLGAPASGISVIVDRQKDVLSEINKAVGKVKGAAVTILFTGFQRVNGVRRASYSISVYTKPIINGDDKLADDIVEDCDGALHNFIPASQNPAQDNCHFRAECSGADLIPDRNFLIYQLNLQANVKS